MRHKLKYKGVNFNSQNFLTHNCQREFGLPGFNSESLPWKIATRLFLEPMLCMEDDDYQSIAPNMEAHHINPEPPTYALRFCPVPGSGHLLGLANEDGLMAFQDTSVVQPKLPMQGLKCHENAIFSFCWSLSDAGRVVTVSGDQTVGVWDLERRESDRMVSQRVLRGHSRSVKCVEWRPGTGEEVATAGRDNTILLWDLRSNSDIHADNAIKGAHKATGGFSTHAHKRKLIASPSSSGPACSVTALCWADSNTLVSTGDNDGVIKLWDVRRNYSLYKKEPQPKMEIPHPGSSSNKGYTCLSLDPAGHYLYASCMDSSIYKHDLVNCHSSPSAVYSGADIKSFFVTSSLSVCGQFLASGSCDGMVYLWHTASSGSPVVRLSTAPQGAEGAEVDVGPSEPEVPCVAFCQEPAAAEILLAAASDDMRHRLWRHSRYLAIKREQGMELEGLRGHAHVLPKEEEEPKFQAKTPSIRTPSTNKKHRRLDKSSSKVATPSIKTFLTPNRQLTPVAESLTPVNDVKRGVKRRNMDFGDENLPHSKTPKLNPTCRDLSNSIAGLLSPNPKSPAKCTFTPESYRSPNKRPPERPPLFLGSPIKSLLHPLRPPLCPLPTASPTANLPNLVKDGLADKEDRKSLQPSLKTIKTKQNWLTQLSKQTKEKKVLPHASRVKIKLKK